MSNELARVSGVVQHRFFVRSANLMHFFSFFFSSRRRHTRYIGDWSSDVCSSDLITFLVATHLATAIVLLIFFWRDWARIVKGLGRSLRDRGIDPDDADAKLGWLLEIGRAHV